MSEEIKRHYEDGDSKTCGNCMTAREVLYDGKDYFKCGMVYFNPTVLSAGEVARDKPACKLWRPKIDERVKGADNE